MAKATKLTIRTEIVVSPSFEDNIGSNADALNQTGFRN